MGKRRNFRSSNTVTNPYGKKVKVKPKKAFVHTPPQTYDWIFMRKDDYAEFKESRNKASYLKEILKDKESAMVVRGTWFVNACDQKIATALRYVFRADRRDRSVEVLGAITRNDDGTLNIRRPPQPIVIYM